SALETLAKVLKKKAVIFLISDFIDGNDYEKTLKIVARKHDLVAMRVLDEKELSLPPLPGLELLDAESGKSFSFSAAGKNREKFRLAAEKEEQTVQELCRRSKVDLIDVRCGEDLVKPLMSFFRSRKKLAR
ncbi:MAG: DUF58 domain-containing protein, partial [Lentisphaeria bacterium]|nr:DUF58 domain-containing protein [Lentisphaeria bacterium]